MTTSLSRRDFLKTAGAAGLTLAVAGPSIVRANTAKKPVRCAVIGVNGRGIALIDGFASLESVSVPFVCDVEGKALAKGLAAARKHDATARGVKDFRDLLADSSIDAFVLATPDHWHAPMAILALQAGKAVYVEKPCGHNPREGELLLDAIAKTGGIVQMGNQRRSFPNITTAIRQIHDGAIGRAYFGRAWYANTRASIGRGRETAPPANLDFDLWQGPAPRRPFRDNLVHYNWHWFWHWGTGEALNNGTHEVDICRWALDAGFPARVTSSGGRYAFEDDWECPDTQTIGWEFEDQKAITWEGRSCNRQPIDGVERGAMIHGTDGSVLLEGDNAIFYDRAGKVVRRLEAGSSAADLTNTVSSTGAELDRLHFVNFIDAVRHGTELTAPISEGHKSVTMLQLGNIAQRVGRDLRTDSATGRIQDDPDAAKLWTREYEPGWEPKV